jgi:hypothetical protein
MTLAFPHPDAAWVEVGPISIVGARHRQRLNLPKSDHLVWETRYSDFP